MMSFLIAGICVALMYAFLLIKKRWQQKLERTRLIMGYLHQHNALESIEADSFCSIIIAQQNIGDITCLYNANSPYLRCTVNPCGPCESCQDYQAKSLLSQARESSSIS